jgi:hypothetical protein
MVNTVLERRLARLETDASQRQQQRWHAAVETIRETMDPKHCNEVAAWLRQHVDGKRHCGPCDGDPRHVCPRCLNALNPPALARAVWLMLLDHTVRSGAPVAMLPDVADVYLNDPDAYPANPCSGCGYLMPTRSKIRPDGSYDHIATYDGDCPVCGLDSRKRQERTG